MPQRFFKGCSKGLLKFVSMISQNSQRSPQGIIRSDSLENSLEIKGFQRNAIPEGPVRDSSKDVSKDSLPEIPQMFPRGSPTDQMVLRLWQYKQSTTIGTERGRCIVFEIRHKNRAPCGRPASKELHPRRRARAHDIYTYTGMTQVASR